MFKLATSGCGAKYEFLGEGTCALVLFFEQSSVSRILTVTVCFYGFYPTGSKFLFGFLDRVDRSLVMIRQSITGMCVTETFELCDKVMV
jgi:hypothetical protein